MHSIGGTSFLVSEVPESMVKSKPKIRNCAKSERQPVVDSHGQHGGVAVVNCVPPSPATHLTVLSRPGVIEIKLHRSVLFGRRFRHHPTVPIADMCCVRIHT